MCAFYTNALLLFLYPRCQGSRGILEKNNMSNCRSDQYSGHSSRITNRYHYYYYFYIPQVVKISGVKNKNIIIIIIIATQEHE